MTEERKRELVAAVLAELRANEGEPMSIKALAFEVTCRPSTLHGVLLEMAAEGLIASVPGYHGHVAWAIPDEGSSRTRSTVRRDSIEVTKMDHMPTDTNATPEPAVTPLRREVVVPAEPQPEPEPEPEPMAAIAETSITEIRDAAILRYLTGDSESLDAIPAEMHDEVIAGRLEVVATTWRNTSAAIVARGN